MTFEHSQTHQSAGAKPAAARPGIFWPVVLGLAAIPALLSLGPLERQPSAPAPTIERPLDGDVAGPQGAAQPALDGRGKWSGYMR